MPDQADIPNDASSPEARGFKRKQSSDSKLIFVGPEGLAAAKALKGEPVASDSAPSSEEAKPEAPVVEAKVEVAEPEVKPGMTEAEIRAAGLTIDIPWELPEGTTEPLRYATPEEWEVLKKQKPEAEAGDTSAEGAAPPH